MRGIFQCNAWHNGFFVFHFQFFVWRVWIGGFNEGYKPDLVSVTVMTPYRSKFAFFCPHNSRLWFTIVQG
jgi:hypothetical protein